MAILASCGHWYQRAHHHQLFLLSCIRFELAYLQTALTLGFESAQESGLCIRTCGGASSTNSILRNKFAISFIHDWRLNSLFSFILLTCYQVLKKWAFNRDKISRVVSVCFEWFPLKTLAMPATTGTQTGNSDDIFILNWPSGITDGRPLYTWKWINATAPDEAPPRRIKTVEIIICRFSWSGCEPDRFLLISPE